MSEPSAPSCEFARSISKETRPHVHWFRCRQQGCDAGYCTNAFFAVTGWLVIPPPDHLDPTDPAWETAWRHWCPEHRPDHAQQTLFAEVAP